LGPAPPLSHGFRCCAGSGVVPHSSARMHSHFQSSRMHGSGAAGPLVGGSCRYSTTCCTQALAAPDGCFVGEGGNFDGGYSGVVHATEHLCQCFG